MTTTTYVFVTAPADETIIASKGTLDRQVIVTESLGFMCLVFNIREVAKMRFLPFYRTRVLASVEDDREAALELFNRS